MARSKTELIKSKVYYFGTTYGGNSFSRHRGKQYFDRGFGELWLTRQAIYFRLYLTLEPFEIPLKRIVKMKTSHFHARKFSIAQILKIYWQTDEGVLAAGFSLPKKAEEMMKWQKKLERVVKAKLK
jgi:hypothetical protein